jgi:hypothetical protein
MSLSFADQGVHRGGTLATAIGADAQPRAAAKRAAAQRLLGGIVIRQIFRHRGSG